MKRIISLLLAALMLLSAAACSDAAVDSPVDDVTTADGGDSAETKPPRPTLRRICRRWILRAGASTI